jgi:hypothetical protein
MDNEEFFIPQNVGETPKALRAKKDYLALGPGRSLEKLLEVYRQHSANGTGTVPTLRKATLANWSGLWGWANLSARYDDHQADRLLEQEFEERKKDYIEQLQQFSAFNKASGKSAFKAAATATKQLLEFIESAEEKGQGIKSWDDAVKVANIMRGILPLADLWGKAMGVDRILSADKLPWE